jgi:hypothetical protein
MIAPMLFSRRAPEPYRGRPAAVFSIDHCFVDREERIIGCF